MTIDMAFAGGPFDHAETQRDTESLQKYVEHKHAMAILISDGSPALLPDGTLKRVHPKEMIGRDIFAPGPLFLGLDNGKPLFAFNLKVDEGSPASEGEQFENMRNVAGRMDPRDLAIAGRAKSLIGWHMSHQFCARCGTQSVSMEGGLKRVCTNTACAREHFPRVNPVVIMLVVHEDSVLLGRGETWPEGAYSALAGFVSPGETMEEAVRREVWEETGVTIENAKYIMSQPWPFPSQLMMGMICEAKGRDLTINTKEIETAQWFDRATVEAVFAKESDAFLYPPRFTIAHQLLRWWLTT